MPFVNTDPAHDPKKVIGGRMAILMWEPYEIGFEVDLDMEDKERQEEKGENQEPQEQNAKEKRAESKRFFLNESVLFFQNLREKR